MDLILYEPEYEAMDTIMQLLKDGPPHIRIYCLKYLGSTGGSGKEREAIIWSLHHDPDPVVRHEAAFWLGEMGDPQATEALARASKEDTEPLVRHECIEALGWIPTPASKKALQAALKDPSEVVRLTARISLDIHKQPRDAWEAKQGIESAD